MPKANELADNEILGTKQHWDEARDYLRSFRPYKRTRLIMTPVWVRLMVSASKSRAWKTATTNDQGKFTVYQSSPFTEDK